jgi:hypothetical protein
MDINYKIKSINIFNGSSWISYSFSILSNLEEAYEEINILRGEMDEGKKVVYGDGETEGLQKMVETLGDSFTDFENTYSPLLDLMVDKTLL